MMYNYGVKRMIEMENRYVKMVEGATPNEHLFNDIEIKSNTLEVVLFEIVDRYVCGDLAAHAKTEMLKEAPVDERYYKLHSYLELYFKLRDKSVDTITFTKYIYRIIEYLSAEIIEITLNQARDRSNMSTLENMMAVIHTDVEIKQTFHYRCIGYFSPLVFDIYDFTNSEIGGLMPTIIFKSDEEKESLQEEEYLESLPKKRKLDTEAQLLRSIPIELHEELVKHFDTLKTLLEMRLVCKYWNYLIVNNPEIWKYLSYYTLKNNPLYSQYYMVDLEILSREPHFISPYGQKIFQAETNWFDFFKIRLFHYLKLSDFIVNKSYSKDYQEVLEFAVPLLKENIQLSLIVKNYHTYFHSASTFVRSPSAYRKLFFIECNLLEGLMGSHCFPKEGGIAFFVTLDEKDCKVQLFQLPMVSKKRKCPNITSTCCFSFDFEHRIAPILEYLPDGDNNLNNLIANQSSENAFLLSPISNSLLLQGCSKENDILLLALLHDKEIFNFVILKQALKKQEFQHCRLYKTKHLTQRFREEKIDPDYFAP